MGRFRKTARFIFSIGGYDGISPIAKESTRERLLQYAVQTAIFCPYSGHVLDVRHAVLINGISLGGLRPQLQVLATPQNACKVRKSSHGKIMLPVGIHLPTDKRGCQ
jgi:hypothetical protein